MVNKYVVAIYLRLSVNNMKTDSLSIENQRKIILEYVNNNFDDLDYTVEEYIDNGYSGTNFERPAIQRLIDDIKADKVNCIIVKDFSRFGRSSIDTQYFLEQIFPIYNVRFIAVSDNYDSNTTGQQSDLDVQFKQLLNEMYSQDLSKKIKSALHTKMKAGTLRKTVYVYGYKADENRNMIIDDNVADNVRLIFNLSSKGLSCRQIAKTLIEMEIESPGRYKKHSRYNPEEEYSCKYWKAECIRHILFDEQYIGTYVMLKQEVIEVGKQIKRTNDESKQIKIKHHHPAIVDENIFYSLPCKQKKKKINHKNPQHINNPLKSKIYCGICRHAMRFNGYNYFCNYTKNDIKAPCHNLKIKKDDIFELVYTNINQYTNVILNKYTPDTKNSNNMKSAKLNVKLKSYKDERCTLYEKYISKEISLSEYKYQKELISAKISELTSIIMQENEERLASEEKNRFYSNIKSNLNQCENSHTISQELLELLVDKIYVYPNKKIKLIWKVNELF